MPALSNRAQGRGLALQLDTQTISHPIDKIEVGRDGAHVMNATVVQAIVAQIVHVGGGHLFGGGRQFHGIIQDSPIKGFEADLGVIGF